MSAKSLYHSRIALPDGQAHWAWASSASLCEGVKVAQMCSSHSRVRRIAYTVSPGSSGGSSCGFSTCLLQSVGQWVIETFWAAQSTSGLGCYNQGCPSITDCRPRL